MDQKKRSYLFAGILVIAVVAVYANHFQNGFHFDDSHTIVNNIFIKDVRNIPRFFVDGTTFSSLPSNQSYRPIVSTTLAIDYWLGNGNLFFFHLSTFLFFLFQGLCMYFFYRSIFGKALDHEWVPMTAFFGVAWYLLHPANAETINYIIARSDSLSALFIVLAFVLYIYSPRCRRWHLYLIPVAIGTLAKPIAGIFAPLLLVYLLLFEERTPLGSLWRKSGIVSLGSVLKKAFPALLGCLLLMVFVRTMDPPTWTPGGQSEFHYLITQPYVVLHYLTTFFLPIGLSADTDLQAFASMADYRFILGTAFIILLVGAAILFSKAEKTRPISFGLLWFLLTLLPTSLIPLAEVMNDHRLFLPYVGLMMSACWALALLLMQLKKSFTSDQVFNRVILTSILVLLAAYAFGTTQRNGVWRTEETLWRDVAEKSPENGRGLMNYGLTLMAKGDYAGAERYFDRARKLTPQYATLYVNFGVLKAATGDTIEADQYFRKAIILEPGYPESYFYYAQFLKDHGRSREAIGCLLTTLRLAPAHLKARYLLMAIYEKRGNNRKLARLINETLQIDPNSKEALSYLEQLKNGRPARPTTDQRTH